MMALATIEELSEYLKVKKFTLYSWVRNGIIPSLKLNGLVRFDMDKIEEWLEKSQRKPEEKTLPLRNVPKELDIDKMIKNAVEEVRPKEYNSNKRETGSRTRSQKGGA